MDLVLIEALDPGASERWVAEKNAGFADPERTRIYLACDRAVDWDADDPRIDRLIEDLTAWETAHPGGLSRPSGLGPVDALVAEASPAWQRVLARLSEL